MSVMDSGMSVTDNLSRSRSILASPFASMRRDSEGLHRVMGMF